MNRLVRALLGPAALLVVNITTAAVLISNQQDGLYSPEADSLGLPIGLTIVASVMSLVALGLVVGARHIVAYAGDRKALKWVALAALVFAYVAVGLFGLAGFVVWLVPHHYVVSWAYAVLLAWLAFEVRTEVLKRRSTANAV
jgi:hypothetical protein